MGLGSASTAGSLVAGLLTLVAFVARSAAVANPLVELPLFRVRDFRAAVVATAAFTLAFTAMFFANVQFLTQVWDYSIVEAGMALIPGPVVVMALAPVFGKVAGRVGQRRLLVPGGLVYAASGLWLVTFLAGLTPETVLDHFRRPWWLLVAAGVATSLLSVAVRPADRPRP